MFEHVLSRLSPTELGTLQPAQPTRMPGDPRMITVICHPYGRTPLLYASASVRRIMALTYVVGWAWQEHRLRSELGGVMPARRLALLVDEIDAHLHPFWQSTILPAILDIGEILDEHLQMQVVVSTHSPFVLASLETRFDPASDGYTTCASSVPGCASGGKSSRSSVMCRPGSRHRYSVSGTRARRMRSASSIRPFSSSGPARRTSPRSSGSRTD